MLGSSLVFSTALGTNLGPSVCLSSSNQSATVRYNSFVRDLKASQIEEKETVDYQRDALGIDDGELSSAI